MLALRRVVPVGFTVRREHLGTLSNNVGRHGDDPWNTFICGCMSTNVLGAIRATFGDMSKGPPPLSGSLILTQEEDN